MLLDLIKIIAILTAAVLLGKWFLAELEKDRRLGKAWYAPYLSPPGIIIVCAVILLPIILWLAGR